MTTPLVITLHGLLRSRYSMSYLGWQIRKHGYEVHNYGYWSLRHNLGEQALLLHNFLQKITSPKQPLSFVTHSLGGIIVRRFALDHGSQYNLKRVVMLGPPNQGSCYARFLSKHFHLEHILGPAFLELCNLHMEPATEIIETGIIAGGTLDNKGLLPFIKENNDGFVALSETILQGAKDVIVVPSLHSVLMYKSTAIKQTISFLNDGVFLH